MSKPTKRARKKPAPKPVVEDEPTLYDIFVVGDCPNRQWKRGMDKSGRKCFVQIPVRLSEMLNGKWVKADKIDGSEENHYNFVA